MSSTSTVSPATHGDRSTTLPSPSLARAAAHLVNLTSLDTTRPHHPASPSSTSASSASTTTSPTPDSLRHYPTSNIPSSSVATIPAATDFMTMPLVSSPISSVPSTTTSRSPSPGVSPRSEFATTRPIPMKAKKSRNALSVVARALHSLRSSTRSPTKDSRLSLEGMASMADCISKMESLPSVSDVAAALTLTRGVQVEPLSTATATGKSSKADEWHLPTEPVALRGPSKSTTTNNNNNNNNNNSSNGKGKTNKKGRLSARAKFLNKPLLSTESANDDAAVRGPNSARSINSDVPSERDVLVALTGSPCGKPTSPSRKRKRSVKPRARALSASSNASTVTDIFDEVATPAPTSSTTTHTAATAILTPVMESSEQPSPAKMPRRSYAVSTPCTVGCISCQGRGCVRYTSMTLMAAGYTPANSTSTSTSAVGVIRPNTSTTTTTPTTTPTTAATANKDASATELVAAASAAAAATASGANPPPAARQLTAQEYTQLLALYFERRRRFEAHLKTARGFDMQSWLAGTSPYTP